MIIRKKNLLKLPILRNAIRRKVPHPISVKSDLPNPATRSRWHHSLFQDSPPEAQTAPSSSGQLSNFRVLFPANSLGRTHFGASCAEFFPVLATMVVSVRVQFWPVA